MSKEDRKHVHQLLWHRIEQLHVQELKESWKAAFVGLVGGWFGEVGPRTQCVQCKDSPRVNYHRQSA